MKILLVLLLARAISCEEKFSNTVVRALNDEPFDVSELNVTARGSKIVFGLTASAGQFKHYALMFVKRPTKIIQCGAGLISKSWVLTADHCVREAVSIELRFGLTHRERYEQRINAAAFARNTDVDIAVIKLKSEVKLTDLVKPALLPRAFQARELFNNQLATVCGFGIENEQTKEISTYLKYTEIKILTQKDCRPYFGDIDINILCAKSMNSLSSTCSGDSGSSLLIREGNDLVIVGVVSFGSSLGCSRGYPVGFVRTTHQLDWIAYYTGIAIRN